MKRMKNDWLIEETERDCPICDKVHTIEKRKRITQGLVKGEVVEYIEVYFLCPNADQDQDNEYVSAGMMDENISRAREAYRIAKSDDLKRNKT